MDIPDIEWENSGLPCDDHSSVIVPDTACPLTDGQLTSLRDAVDPRAASQSFGTDIYIAAVRFCEQFHDLWMNWSERLFVTVTRQFCVDVLADFHSLQLSVKNTVESTLNSINGLFECRYHLQGNCHSYQNLQHTTFFYESWASQMFCDNAKNFQLCNNVKIKSV